MLRKMVLGIVLALLLVSMLTLAFDVRPVKASRIIYIRADGSIDPPTALMERDSAFVTQSSIDWWPMPQHDERRTGYSTSLAPNTNNTLWKYTTESHINPVVVTDGKVFLGSYDGKVYALNASTGAPIWNFTTGYESAHSVSVCYGRVFATSGMLYTSGNGKLYALNATTGAFDWSYSIDSRAGPNFADGKVYIGSLWPDNKLYALNATTGAYIWSFQVGGDLTAGSAALADGKVFMGAGDYKVYALNATDGSLIWSYQTGGRTCSSIPCVVDGKVFMGSDDGKVYALNATSGALIWNFTGDYGTLWCGSAVAYGKVFVGSYQRNSVVALNMTNGDLIWNYTTGGEVLYPVVADGKVFMGSGDCKVYALDATNGSLIWSYATSDEAFYPAVADGKLYIGSKDGKVYAFGVGVYDVAVTNVMSSKTVVGQGYSANINVTAANQGSYQEAFNVTLCAQSQTPANDTGLVGYWKFDEGAGTTAYDSSGNNNHGTLVNEPTWVDGKLGKALRFDGLDDYADIGNWFDYQTFTIEMWVNPGVPQTAYANIIDNNHRTAINWVMQQDSTTTNRYTWGGTMDGSSLLHFDLTPDQWTHVAITRDGNTKANTVYINGKAFLSSNGTSDISYDGNQFVRLARWGAGDRNWNGTMDEVKIYNRALSASEIWTEYAFSPIQTQTVTLDSGESTNLTFTWNTNGFAKGNYTISAYAWPVPDETDTSDNLFIDGWVFVAMVGDVNADGKVDVKDIYAVCRAYGTSLEGPNPPGRTYVPECDITGNRRIDVIDYYMVCRNYGRTDP